MIAKEELPVLGGYQLLEKLGQGGMGAVYKARQLSMDRIVAVKILPPKFSRDPQFVERFQREARLAGRMNHENVVNAFDVGEERGYHYLAMEFVEGTTVGAILKKHGPFAEKEALRICRQVAMALKCAHSNSLIHRDIKPDNIMIDSRGIVKLADMGLARATNEDTSLTQTGMALGTPHYASPEQARGDRDIDHRCDFYSLGATLYHMLTGKTPYEGGSPAAIMAQHLMHDPVPAHERAPERDIGDGASELVMRLMAKNRDDRPRDADELLEMFDLALSGMPPAGALAAESGPKRRTGRHAPVGDSGRDRNRRRTTGHFVPIDAARSVISDRPGKPAARRKGERGAETAAKANPMVLGGAVAAVLLVSAALLMALSGPNSSDKPRSESAAARAPDSEPPVPAAAAAPAVAPAPVRPAPEVAPRQPEPGRPHPRTHQPRHEPELGEPAGAPIRVHARPAAMPIAQPPQREAEAPRTAVPAPSEAPVQAAPAEPEISADARRGYAYLTDKIAERMKELNVEESTGLLEKALQAQVLAPFRQELKADLDDVAWAGKYLAQAEANVPARAGQTFAHKLGRVAVKGFKDGKVELGIDRQGVLAEPMAKLPPEEIAKFFDAKPGLKPDEAARARTAFYLALQDYDRALAASKELSADVAGRYAERLELLRKGREAVEQEKQLALQRANLDKQLDRVAELLRQGKGEEASERMAALKGEFDESVREPLADKWERLAKEADAQSGRPRHLTVKVPAGPFKYGPEGVVVNLPEYEIDKYEVSNAQYRKFVKWLIQDPHPKATSKKLAMVRHPDGPWAVKEYIPRYFPELSEFAEGLIRSYRDRIQGEAGMDEGREGKDARWFQNDPKAYLEHIERERNRFRALTDAGVTGDDYPVVDVTWYAAYAYAKWLGRKLPSAEQWDKAARGADGRDMPAGRWSSRDAALYNGGNSYEFKEDGFPFLAPVASMVEGASPYGAQHMSGNAWEWIDKPGECRGGSWRRCQGHLSLNCRDGETRPGAEHRYEDSGFRTVSGTP